MLKAIIFDFDGVIADTEPIHLEAFKIVLNNREIVMTDEQYFNKYLAYDDKTLFEKIYTDNGREITEKIINDLIDEKHMLITELFSKHVAVFPGIEDFIKRSAGKYTLAIASGALRSEIEYILNKYRLDNFFQSITSADEVLNCKPDPEPFLKALDKIKKDKKEMLPSECLVLEDSVYGVEAAKAAGMKCVAVTNSYEHNFLNDADLVVDGFNELQTDTLEGLFNSD